MSTLRYKYLARIPVVPPCLARPSCIIAPPGSPRRRRIRDGKDIPDSTTSQGDRMELIRTPDHRFEELADYAFVPHYQSWRGLPHARRGRGRRVAGAPAPRRANVELPVPARDPAPGAGGLPLCRPRLRRVRPQRQGHHRRLVRGGAARRVHPSLHRGTRPVSDHTGRPRLGWPDRAPAGRRHAGAVPSPGDPEYLAPPPRLRVPRHDPALARVLHEVRPWRGRPACGRHRLVYAPRSAPRAGRWASSTARWWW
jgi:hypothetical protein